MEQEDAPSPENLQTEAESSPGVPRVARDRMIATAPPSVEELQAAAAAQEAAIKTFFGAGRRKTLAVAPEAVKGAPAQEPVAQEDGAPSSEEPVSADVAPTQVVADAPERTEAETEAPESADEAPSEEAAPAVADASQAEEAPEDPFGDAPAVAKRPEGIGDEAEASFEKPRVARGRGIAEVVHNANMLSCGDDIEVNPKKEALHTFEERMKAMNIPPRPSPWPAMMPWPNMRDLERLEQMKATDEQWRKYWERMEERKWEMVERAREIDQWIRENDPLRIATSTRLGSLRVLRNRAIKNGKIDPYEDHDQKHSKDAFRGVGFATLLDPSATRAQSTNVRSWSHSRVNLMDGGIVRATDTALTFGRHDGKFHQGPSEQSIQFALREGMARGWKTFRVRGTPEFTNMVEKYARELGIKVEIHRYTALKAGFGTRKRLVMPAPPSETAQPAATRMDQAVSPDPDRTIDAPISSVDDRKRDADTEMEVGENPDVTPFAN